MSLRADVRGESSQRCLSGIFLVLLPGKTGYGCSEGEGTSFGYFVTSCDPTFEGTQRKGSQAGSEHRYIDES